MASTPSEFDPNVFTRFSKSGDAHEANVRLLCDMLTTTLIPRVVENMKKAKEYYVDTNNIVSDMHSVSVNARYLGAVAEACEEAELKELCEEEMIARAAKHVLRDLLSNAVLMSAPAFATTAFLNAVLCKERKNEILLSGKNKKSKKVPSLIAQTLLKQGLTVSKIWSLLEEAIKTHFHYTLAVWAKPATVVLESGAHQQDLQRYRLLRRVCQQCGIRLEAVKYDLSEDYVIRVENVLEFVPVVKYAFTPRVDELVGCRVCCVVVFVVLSCLSCCCVCCYRVCSACTACTAASSEAGLTPRSAPS